MKTIKNNIMNKKIKLHYGCLDQNIDVFTFELSSITELNDKIDELCCGNDPVTNKVYLFAVDGFDGHIEFVFVSESYLEIEEIILSHKRLKNKKDFFFHEYESFEDAYSVALSLKEVNPLCYNK